MDSLSFHRYDVFLKRLFYYITSFCFCQHFFEIFLKFFISFCCLHSRGDKTNFLVLKSRFTSFQNPKFQDVSQSVWLKTIWICNALIWAKPAWNLRFPAFFGLLSWRVLVYNITFFALCQHIFSGFLCFGGLYIFLAICLAFLSMFLLLPLCNGCNFFSFLRTLSALCWESQPRLLYDYADILFRLGTLKPLAFAWSHFLIRWRFAPKGQSFSCVYFCLFCLFFYD